MSLPRAPTAGAQPFPGPILPLLMGAGRVGISSLVEGSLAFWELLSQRLADKAQPELQPADLPPPRWANGPGEVLGYKEEGAGLTHTADSALINCYSQTLNKCVWECHVSARQTLLIL